MSATADGDQAIKQFFIAEFVKSCVKLKLRRALYFAHHRNDSFAERPAEKIADASVDFLADDDGFFLEFLKGYPLLLHVARHKLGEHKATIEMDAHPVSAICRQPQCR
ncbi:hypothetical protein [Rhizobium sp. NXC14]|uniref:hypothetical protein n=1 Tax=Rhizobium sp. NXC14 TaxID=1981173 RepID=UPI0012F4D796|nr:hypothetical protein [Rhizobium sp. NXC14]